MSVGVRRVRAAVYARDNYTCHYCLKVIEDRVLTGRAKSQYENHLTIDHIIPQSEGGSHRMDNLVTACRDCNSERQSIPYETFLLISKVRLECRVVFSSPNKHRPYRKSDRNFYYKKYRKEIRNDSEWADTLRLRRYPTFSDRDPAPV